jgi:hypothetical protein
VVVPLLSFSFVLAAARQPGDGVGGQSVDADTDPHASHAATPAATERRYDDMSDLPPRL